MLVNFRFLDHAEYCIPQCHSVGATAQDKNIGMRSIFLIKSES